MYRDAAGCMPRNVDDAWESGQVQRGAVGECHDLVDRSRAESAVSRAVPKETQQGAHLDGSPAGVGFTNFTASPGRIEIMDAYRNAVSLPESLREADVVAIAVSQHHAPNIIKRAAHLCQLMLKLTPLAGQTGVDDRDPRSILN